MPTTCNTIMPKSTVFGLGLQSAVSPNRSSGDEEETALPACRSVSWLHPTWRHPRLIALLETHQVRQAVLSGGLPRMNHLRYFERSQRMPSKAFGTFNYNLDDVHRLVQAYEALKPTGQGKRGLGHLTRSSIVTLCACWEQYIEDVIIEGVTHFKDQIDSPDNLPLSVRKVISKKVRRAKNELKPLELAGHGWKDIYLAFAKDEVGNLHSPKTERIQVLLSNYLGFGTRIEETWTCGKKELDDFVGLRNSISHRGKSTGKYIKYWEVGSSIELISTTVVETDNALSDHLGGVLPNGRPWNRKRV